MTLSELITQLRELESEGFGDSTVELRIIPYHPEPAAELGVSYRPEVTNSTVIDAVYCEGQHVVVEG